MVDQLHSKLTNFNQISWWFSARSASAVRHSQYQSGNVTSPLLILAVFFQNDRRKPSETARESDKVVLAEISQIRHERLEGSVDNFILG